MTETKEVTPSPVVTTRSKKLREDKLRCNCKSPKPVPFRIPASKPNTFNVGMLCDNENCYEVLSWSLELPEKVENIEKVKEKPKETPPPVLEKLTKSYFPIADVTAIKNATDKIAFSITHNGKLFVIPVPSTPAKIEKLIKDPSVLIGKEVLVEYSKATPDGVPIDGRVIELKK